MANLLNPKVGAFYVTYLPQFIPVQASVAAYWFPLTAIHVLLAPVWFALPTAATIQLRKRLRRPAVVRTLERTTGALFISFGLKLAVSNR